MLLVRLDGVRVVAEDVDVVVLAEQSSLRSPRIVGREDLQRVDSGRVL